ncbi:MAG: hypothetical protein ACOH1Y_09235 [Propionicimonas sp.]
MIEVELWHDTTMWNEGFEKAREPLTTAVLAGPAEAHRLELWVQTAHGLMAGAYNDYAFQTRLHPAGPGATAVTVVQAQAAFTAAIDGWDGI